MILPDTDIDKKFNRGFCQLESDPVLVHCLPKILWHALADSRTKVTPTHKIDATAAFWEQSCFSTWLLFWKNTNQSGFIGFSVSVQVIEADLVCWLMEHKASS